MRMPAKKTEGRKRDDDIDKLVDQLGRMSVNDAKYAFIYLKAYTLNPAIKDIIPTPKEQRERME